MRVIFFGDSAYLLDEYRKTDEGCFTARVINGNWLMRYSRGLVYVADEPGGRGFKADITREVKIPASVKGDYNELIEWARVQP